MRRLAVMLCATAGALLLLFGLGGSPAWAEGEQGFQGTLKNRDAGDEPVTGVTLSVLDENGKVVDTTESGDDGTWQLLVEEPGQYHVELDESTLPDGLSVINGRAILDVRRVDSGRLIVTLFPLGTKALDDKSDDSNSSTTQDARSVDECEVDPETGEEICGGATFANRLGNIIYNGIHFGLIIALAAVGLSLIFGTMGLTNFAHGELVTLGGAVAYLVNVSLGVPVLAAFPIAIVLGGVFGWVQDRYFWGWLRKRGTGLITMMIISIGVALALRYGINFTMGPNTERLNEYVRQDSWDLMLFHATPKKLVVDVIAIVAVVAVALILIYTRFGKAVRAVADNPRLAEASGINVDQVIRWVWTAGGALAATAGAALALERGVKFDMGMQLLLLIFAAVVLGGLGTSFGAVVGALIIGLFTQFTTLWIEPQLKYVGALGILIVVLLVRPQGIFGRRERIG